MNQNVVSLPNAREAQPGFERSDGFMFKRQIRRFQCQLRHGANRLYHGYIASILRGLEAQTPVDAVDVVLEPSPVRNRCHANAINAPLSPPLARKLKLHGDFGCAKVREQLWQLQHLHQHPSPVISGVSADAGRGAWASPLSIALTLTRALTG